MVKKDYSNIADSWDDVTGPNGETLIIGGEKLSYARRNKNEMIDNGGDWKPSPREVKVAMHLLLRFQLFDAASTDSLMREIALKQKNVSGNLLRYDKEFASNFIHFLCLNLTFDDYSQRTSPPKNMNQRFINQSTELFKHNFRILVHYLKSIDEVLFNHLAINKTGGTTIFDEKKIKTFNFKWLFV